MLGPCLLKSFMSRMKHHACHFAAFQSTLHGSLYSVQVGLAANDSMPCCAWAIWQRRPACCHCHAAEPALARAYEVVFALRKALDYRTGQKQSLLRSGSFIVLQLRGRGFSVPGRRHYKDFGSIEKYISRY